MLSIILPTYCERENLALLVPEISRILCGENHEVIIVDDSSGDGTDELVSGLTAKNPCIRILKRKQKLGLASAVVDGARISNGEFLLVMDADLSHPPEKIQELISGLGTNDLVIGSRSKPGGGVQNWPLFRKMVSSGASGLARLLLGVKISDPMSGFFAIRKDVFLKTRFRVKGYKILLNILADNPKIRIREIPYFFKNRFAGTTKLGAMEFYQYLLDLFSLKFF